jgi:hypothetical protein
MLHLLGAYLVVAGITGRKGEPLIRSLDRHRQFTRRRLAARGPGDD